MLVFPLPTLLSLILAVLLLCIIFIAIAIMQQKLFIIWLWFWTDLPYVGGQGIYNIITTIQLLWLSITLSSLHSVLIGYLTSEIICQSCTIYFPGFYYVECLGNVKENVLSLVLWKCTKSTFIPDFPYFSYERHIVCMDNSINLSQMVFEVIYQISHAFLL